MSVQAGPIFKRYAANGIAVLYAIPFKVMDAGDLQITLNDVLVTSGFTLGPLGGDSTSCTFDVPPAGDLLFQLVLPFQRLTDYQTNGDLLAVTINRDLDRIWLALKQLIGSNDRALSTDISEPEGVAPLPLKAARALKLLAFDVDSNPIASSLTLAQLEEQPALALASAEASQIAAANAEAAAQSAAASASFAGDPWNFQPLGVPIAIFNHLTGVTAPPADSANYRYIKLTASDSYNTGVLTGESVSGSAPLVLATAVVSDLASPMNGQTIRLINTERRVLRAGSSGTIEADALQNLTGTASPSAGSGLTTPSDNSTGVFAKGAAKALFPSFGNASGFDLTFDASRVARTADETRPKNIGATYYMRIR
ncbi:hypothetical protein DBR00_11440 [Pseudomonas sp. HMWF032]|uniref:hypothetical protein n=1 Tax=Pseudomonas sp. HMWF032 TaxID=2056866 RepID=UPI000D3951C5|nr:hypothetical protein [Pseudomonas sp. HMWF032]PTS83988.1 hypothetical protein DBR00_11440 [Pseudomonas sp. HMWF032]PTT85343.1 hypothetical protein DBR41_04025 [Pseudomonas sp. HMWF010]